MIAPSAAPDLGTTTIDATDRSDCHHCGLPVPAHRVADDALSFCCAGCEAVHGALSEHGLERYYELREQSRPAEAIDPATRGYEEFDDPKLQQSILRADADGTSIVEFYLEGVHCAACVWLVEKLPALIAGVRSARLDVRRRIARISFQPSAVRLSTVARTLQSLGYRPHLWRRGDKDELRRTEHRRHLIRIGVAGACAGNAMLLAFGLWGGAFHGIEVESQRLLRGASLLFCLIAIFGPGATFLRGAWSSIRARVLHMDVPVAIALLTGTLYGAANTYRGTGEVYFESLTAVVFLLLLGRYLQFRQREAAEDSVSLLFTAVPGTSFRLDDAGTEQKVPIEALEVGDRVRVHAGETVPADGEIEDGGSTFDLSLLTGESKPVTRREGERVHAGTINVGGPVTVRIEHTGSETRLGRLMALVEQLASERPPIVHLADRIAHGFVICVLGLALATAIGWWSTSPAQAIENAVALLIVTCPCALGLATPLAIQAAIGKAARAGILIKQPDVLERLTQGGPLFLDKTGTVTEGRLAASLITGRDNDLHLAAEIEQHVTHPSARAIVEASRAIEHRRSVEPARNIEHEPGRGVSATIGARAVRVGSRSWIKGLGTSVGPEHEAAFQECLRDGISSVMVSIDGDVAAVIALDDVIRKDSKDAISRLRALGFQPALLSGDHPEIARRVGSAVGIEPNLCEGGASPEGKADRIRAAGTKGESSVMVGDGLNDAAALSAASVSIAVKGGAEASLAASDVYLSKDGLLPLVDLVVGGRRTVGLIRRGIALSLGYNLVSGSMAIAGLIHPLAAAILMPISSLTVVATAFRSRTFEQGP